MKARCDRWVLPVVIAAGLLFLFQGITAGPVLASVVKAKDLEAMAARLNDCRKNRPEDRIYLMCDKHFYYPGETLWFQAYVRNGVDLSPSINSEIVHVEWIGPAGDKVAERTLIARNGTASGDIALSEDAPGGRYRLRAFTRWQKNQPNPFIFEKEIPVQHVVVPRVKMRLDYLKAGYGPGDRVQAAFSVRGLDDRPLTRQACTVTVKLGDGVFLEKTITTDDQGKALIRFDLPGTLDPAGGLVNVSLDYQGLPESLSRSLPLLTGRLQVGFFPEGGDLIAGLASRVALRVLDQWGKPADIEGVIETDTGRRVADVATVHQGKGLFSLTPEKDRTYRLRVTKPRGIETLYPLPAALERGYVLEVTPLDERKSLDIMVRSTETETLLLALRSRCPVAAFVSLPVKPGDNRTRADIGSFPMGVCQVTLFDSRGIERAERLTFINEDKQLDIRIVTDKAVYLPREKVTMLIGVRDDRGMPVPSQLSLSVTDDRLHSFAADTSGTILSKLLLEPDLTGEVYEPSKYFSADTKNRIEALDLLMMTQGWRRFTWEQVLAEERPPLAFKPEKAEIRGFVYDSPRRRNPVAGAVVTIGETGKTVITDKDGAFVISDLDLYEPRLLSCTDGKRNGEVSVRDYDETAIIYLEPPVRFKKGFNFLKFGDDTPMVEARAGGPAVAEADAPPEPAPKEPQPGRIPAELEDLDLPRDRGLIIADDRPAGETRYYRARVFPAPVYTTTAVEERSDFRSTVFFKGQVETDRRGMATLEFYNNDAVGSFRATVEGIGVTGLAGRCESAYATTLPVSLDLKAPVSVAMGDTLRLPLVVTNATAEAVKASLTVTAPPALKPLMDLTGGLVLKAGASKRFLIPFEVQDIPGPAALVAQCRVGGDTDTLRREIRVVPRGFPVKTAVSDRVMDRSFDVTIDKPVAGSIEARLTAYPTVLSDMLAGIKAILQEPYGCFEQASSSTYPNIMVLDYLNKQESPDPDLIKRAGSLIDTGYKKLTAYETREKGYEWFGQTPGHEALTAYGLMEFADMRQVYDGVDPAMVKRTADWLMARRDGKGGFLRSEQALDSFGRADEDITNAYIVYALSEAGFVHDIQKELDRAHDAALAADDPYMLALAANALFHVRDQRGGAVLGRLMPHQGDDGGFTGKRHSITRSTGTALTVETTALAALAMLKSETPDRMRLGKAVRFIVGARQGQGGFGNTQSTVLALKALSAFARFARKTAESGRIIVEINGRTAGEVAYAAGQSEPIVIDADVLSSKFSEGKTPVRVRFTETGEPLPFTFALAYNTFEPTGSADCPLSLDTRLSADTVKAGDTVTLTVRLTNQKEGEGLPMSLARIGVPGGLGLVPGVLAELQDKGRVDFIEIFGNDPVLYFRQMKPGETRTVSLTLKAEIPGTYQAAASSAYLYYTREHKVWTPGETVTVTE
ncbi:hypothetical protein JCM14469_02210 [Desulfatiferula olefinivorans]